MEEFEYYYSSNKSVHYLGIMEFLIVLLKLRDGVRLNEFIIIKILARKENCLFQEEKRN